MTRITENSIEEFAIELLEKLGYESVYGPDIAPDGDTSTGSMSDKRESYEQVLLIDRLRKALKRINRNMPADILEDAVKEIRRIHSPELLTNNETFHRFLTEGIPVSKRVDGDDRGDLVWMIDFKNPYNNDFLVVNQFTVVENNHTKRPDIILFVNGIPLVVIELKNAADENASIRSAFRQIETYKSLIPTLFTYNGFVVISDGMEAKAGTISSGFSRFMAWPVCVQRTGRKSVDGKAFMYNKFYTYVIECEDGSYYIGQASDLASRWNQHLCGQGAEWTKTHKPIRIIHHEIFPNREEAIAREKELKTGFGRKWIKREIEAGRNKPFFPDGETEIRAKSNSDTITWHQGYISQLETLILGMLNKKTLIDLIRHFIVFEKTRKEDPETRIITINTVKKMAAYHQYYAVNRAVESTLRAAGYILPEALDKTLHELLEGSYVNESPESYGLAGVKKQPVGDRKGGVVWHTQGSGKSLSMVFFTGKIVLAMDNPTVVVITDRNDLDDQLFDTFPL